MITPSSTPVGLTRDVGFEIGVSRTIGAPLDAVWDYLTSEEGIARWLGGGLLLPADRGAEYRTPDGTRGEMRSFRPGDRMRLTWQPADWAHDTTVQIAVRARGERTMLRFHQERLADADERVAQREHWMAVMDAVIGDLTEGEARSAP